MKNKHPCPCCGHITFSEPPGSCAICPICYWEDDALQLAFPDLAGGANKCSLLEGQRNYEQFGACEHAMLQHVRKPLPEEKRDASWRQIDSQNDRYLRWNDPSDRKLWDTVKNTNLILAYWDPDYWIKAREG
jgi:hypothetical protein